MKATMVMAAFAAAISAQGEVELSAAADRVESPLRVDMKCVGTLAPRSVKDIRSSNWTLGCETLDRDFADFRALRVPYARTHDSINQATSNGHTVDISNPENKRKVMSLDDVWIMGLGE